MAPKHSHIHNLTSHVYGPYHDYVLFKDTYPADSITLRVHDLQMYYDNREIGFDDTEFIGNPPEGSIAAKNGKVVYFVVYEIPSLGCLSDRGLEYLQRDLREYDQKIHLEHHRSGLTLQTLYGDKAWVGSRIHVRIACAKTLTAHYSTSKNDPEKLIMYSIHEGKRRRLWVETLHVTTFRMSRNFFDRYQLRALLEQLIDTDQENTPVEDRNIDWLIQRYLDEIHPRDAHNRIIVDPSFEAEISSEPRHLNHLPRARIRHYFASQAEWLLAHMIASSSKQVKLLNIDQWIQFCHQARRDSIEADRNGVQWGLAHGATVDAQGKYSLSRNLAKFGHNQTFWKKKLELLRRNRVKEKKAPFSPEIPVALTPSAAQFQYDSDFSEDSTSDDVNTEPEVPSAPKVPLFCLESPRIRDGLFTWICPGQGCDYTLDLLNLSRENLSLLPRDVVRILNDKAWKTSDVAIRNALGTLVSHHYEVHLNQTGVHVKESSGRCVVQPLHPPKNTKQGCGVVKQEDKGVLLETVRRSSRNPRPRRQYGV